MNDPVHHIFYGKHDQLSYAESYSFYYKKTCSLDGRAFLRDIFDRVLNYEQLFLESIFVAGSYRWDVLDEQTFEELKLRRQMVIDVLLYPIRVGVLDVSRVQSVHEVYKKTRRRFLERYKAMCLSRGFLEKMQLSDDLIHIIMREFLDFHGVHVAIRAEKTDTE